MSSMTQSLGQSLDSRLMNVTEMVASLCNLQLALVRLSPCPLLVTEMLAPRFRAVIDGATVEQQWDSGDKVTWCQLMGQRLMRQQECSIDGDGNGQPSTTTFIDGTLS